jgi:hypothetical protein
MIVTCEPFVGVMVAPAAGAFVVALDDGDPELLQAAINAAAPTATGAAHHRLRIGHISVSCWPSILLP